MEHNQEIPDNCLLEISNIDVFYESFQALWNVSISVKTRDIIAIKGDPGSGKTTLLNTISGMIHPAKGNIYFSGKDISALRPFQIVDLGISRIPECDRLFSDLTVLENLIIGSFIHKARFKIEQNLKIVYRIFPSLEDKKDCLAKTLSDSDKKALAIGRGLMSNPRLLLLDEMHTEMTPIRNNKFYKILRQIRKQGITVIFVESNRRKSIVEADRVYVMESGRILIDGNITKRREIRLF